MTSKYPNELEAELIDDFLNILKLKKVKHSKQNSPRGTKIHVNHKDTRVTFHIYNVSDKGRGF